MLDVTKFEDINFTIGNDLFFPLMLAVKQQNFVIVKMLLLNMRISANKKDAHGLTSLHVAA